ncbi:hypothetical protein DYB36_012950, partial [Aphanomyces astaci]
PNVGKSSVINALRKKRVCKVAPIPGETKVWQYITLMRRIFLIDCPGVVYDGVNDGEVETVLKGVVRAEKLPQPAEFIQPILDRVKKEHVIKVYGIPDWTDDNHFLDQLAIKSGKLLPKGEADHNNVAVQVINDFIRGKLPWFIAPPLKPEEQQAVEEGKDVSLEELAAFNAEALKGEGIDDDEEVEEEEEEEEEEQDEGVEEGDDDDEE